MTKRKRTKYYAVARGRKTGIFTSWDECSRQVNGYTSARFKSFSTQEEAQTFLHDETNKWRSSNSNHNEIYTSNNRDKLEDEETARTSKRPRTNNSKAEESKHLLVENPYSRKSDTQASARLTQKEVAVVLGNDETRITIHINFDGGSRGNPGIAGAGAVVTLIEPLGLPIAGQDRNGSEPPMRRTWHVREFLTRPATNNEAEYQGLIAALRVAKQEIDVLMREKYKLVSNASQASTAAHSTQPRFKLVIQGDSDMIVKQIKGTYQCKNAKLKPLLKQVQGFIDDFRKMGDCQLSVEHVYREFNTIADALANQAMDAKRSWVRCPDIDGATI